MLVGKLENMLNPKAVALIGASEKEGTVGNQIMKNLLQGKEKRKIYPVNPSYQAVMGLKCFPSITQIPEHVDLAVIAIPAKSVPAVVDECGRSGVDGVVIISSGFREAGEEGAKLEQEIKKLQEKYGLRILGPNCLGFIRPHDFINTTFLRSQPQPGEIAFISQSGALGSAILDWAVSTHIGFSMFASLGSMLDIDFGDLIDYLGEDPRTRSVIIYMEGVGSARKFISAAKGFARTKPIIIIKPGKYAESAKAVKSHTGALAGNFEVYQAAFRRAGVVMVDEIEDLFNCASVLDSRYLPAGPNIAVVTNAGGPGVIAADAIIDNFGELADLSPETITALNKVLPPQWSKGNPVDILGDADVERYAKALEACLSDPKIDGIVVLYTPQGAAKSTDLAKKVVEIAQRRLKPILTVWMGENEVEEARRIFYQNDVPTYPTPEKAIRTYMYMYKYKRNLELLYETPEELSVDLSPPKSHLRLIIRRAVGEGRTNLTQAEIDKFFDAYRIPRPEAHLAKNEEEAVAAASRMGYPVVLKIASPEIIHKTDVGGVVVGIDSEESLRKSYRSMLESIKNAVPKAKIDGVYVQKMKKFDYELILGAKKDRDFGSVILFGQGGIGVEFYRDFSIALPPLNQTLARRLMEETKIYRAISRGIRNKPPVDMKALEEIIVRFSSLVVDFPEFAEIDINPLVASKGEITALDARATIDVEALKLTDPYAHLSILPYPTKYVLPWRLKDGTEVLLRPIRPEDEKIEYEFIKGLSEETSRFRFFRVIKELSHDDLVRFCNIDYDREMAIIAETTEAGKKKEIGVARLIIEPGKKRGEFAIVVADKYQGKGLGTKLMDMLIEFAQEKGLETVYGIIMRENKKMVRLAQKMGFTLKPSEEGYVATLNLV
ncbi:MAG: bifunctional acetate--CoA ligase family protein/GNAT family N-acetyltransferase [Candidatus Hadarchaeum sp.]|uniref:bifunctional acetate--CoA ligase family protein/GNAT family N-acetyltransferase n=1 Tax=Candidatus Hadarchaeum sp. TaxID=2883567 RepID=UPI003D0D5156